MPPRAVAHERRGPRRAAPRPRRRAPARTRRRRPDRCGRAPWRERHRALGAPCPARRGRRRRRAAGACRAAWRHGDQGLTLVGRRARDHLELGRHPATESASAPVAMTAGLRDRAPVDVLEPVGAVPAEPDRSVAVDREAHPGAPAQTRRGPRRPAPPRRGARPRPAAQVARRRGRPSGRRWAPSSTCWKSQPPQRPGPAWGHGGATRSGDGRRISTASARRYEWSSR